MSRLKMAVVGVGALGRHHARILSELPEVDLVAVAETDPRTGERVADACGTRWVADFRDLHDCVDAVSIVVPTHAHALVASEFLAWGIPVLVEKPLAGDVATARQLVDLARDNGTMLQVGHIERFNPATEVAWSRAGAPKYVRAERVSPYAFRSTDIGVVHDLMIHDIDLVLDLVRAPVRSVEALGIGILGENEDAVQARIVFDNGCVADLTASRVNPTARRAMQIWSLDGTVTVDFTSREVTHYRPSQLLLFGKSPLECAREPGADIDALKREIFGKYLETDQPHVPDADALTAELSEFVECVTAGKRPRCDGSDALAALEVADRVLEAVASDRWNGCDDGVVGPYPVRESARRLAG